MKEGSDRAVADRAPWRSPPVALIGTFPPPWGGQAIYNERLMEELTARGIPMRAINVGEGGGRDAGHTRVKLARLLLRDPFSLFHLTASDSRMIGLELIVATASRMRRAPFIYNILAGRFAVRTAAYSGLHRVLLCRAMRRARWILVSNQEMAEAIRRLPLLADAAVEVIGCRLPLGVAPTDDPRLLAFLKDGDPAIVTVGAMRTVYGLDVLVHACSLLASQGRRPKALLILSGASEPEAEASLEAALAGMQPQAAVLVRRDVPRERVLGAIRAADVVVRPTRADGDSVSIHEAQTLGVPVVASDAAPRPSGVVLHRTDDAASLARAIQTAATLPRTPHPEETTLVDRVETYYRTLAGEPVA